MFGNTKHLEHREQQILDDRDRLIRVDGSVQNVTEQKMARSG